MSTIYKNEEIEIEYHDNSGNFSVWGVEDSGIHFVASFSKEQMK